MMSAKTYLKRQKIYHFHKEWEEDYFFCHVQFQMCVPHLLCQHLAS